MGQDRPIPGASGGAEGAEDADALAAFRDDAPNRAEQLRPKGQPFELLTFRFQSNLLAVRAHQVSRVIGWRTPFAVPGGAAAVAGVVQDGGRIIVVLHHPAGIALPPKERPARIVVCDTRKGPIGLPAMETRAVGAVIVEGTPAAGDLLETEDGVATFLDVEEIVEKVLRGGA
jgi:chemotaxis signal transduction protein